MAIRKLISVTTLLLIALSVIYMIPQWSIQEISTNMTPVDSGQISEAVNLIENAGFDTGDFLPWEDVGDTGYNQIRSDEVYTGSYSCFLDSHLSSVNHPIRQYFDTSYSLDIARYFSAAVYPTKVGNTAGEAGVDYVSVTIRNKTSDTFTNVIYEWSGYTFPGGDKGVNVTKVMYLLFDLIPNQWNLIERDIYSDYCAFFGTPDNPSELVVHAVLVLSHISNGDPGDFWIDDISIRTTGTAPPSSLTWHHDCSNTTGWRLNTTSSTLNKRDDVELFSDSDYLYSGPIPWDGERWNLGGLFLHDLPYPLSIEGIELAVRLRIVGTSSRMGGVLVGLFDQHLNWCLKIQLDDGWYGSTFKIHTGYLDEDQVGHEYVSTFSGSWEGEARIWTDAFSVMSQDPAGTREVPTDSQYNPEREIHYVGVFFYSKADYIYETEYVEDLQVTGEVIPQPTSTSTSTSNPPTTSTNSPPPPGPGGTNSWLVFLIGGSGGVIIIALVIILALRRGRTGEASVSEYQW